jgi:uncharacterized repeat protein (TIGR01451 family)
METAVDSVSELNLTVSATPSRAVEGDTFTYNMTFTNKGPSDSNQGFILDYTPAGLTFLGSSVFPCGAGAEVVLCNLGPVVPAGFTATFPVKMKIPPNFLPKGTSSETIVNAAEISSSSIDPKAGSLPVSITTVVVSP